MRKYRGSISRAYNMVVWSVILILSVNLLIEGFMLVGLEKHTYNKVNNNPVITYFINYIAKDTMPVLKLVEDKRNGNMIDKYLSSLVPIVQYTKEQSSGGKEDESEIKYSKYIKDSEDNLLLLKEETNPLSNNYYVTMILRGIEEARHTSNVEYLAELENKGMYLGGGGRGALTLVSNALPKLIPIDIISGEVYMEEKDYHSGDSAGIAQTISNGSGETFTLEQLKNLNYLYNNFYIVSDATSINNAIFNPSYMVNKDFSLTTTSDKPQILVYHTHSQETFADSKEGNVGDSIVGVGTYLTEILTEEYGYNVIHDTSTYDMMEGYLNRNLAYNHASEGIKKILADNPSIEVVIDVHRDGNDKGMKRVTKIGGKDTAQIMLFNGLSRDLNGNIDSLYNKYQKENLAFSLQLQLKGRELFPGLMYKNYLHAYRYNLHYREMSLLAEVGTNYNTVSEAKNSMVYLASLLDRVLNDK